MSERQRGGQDPGGSSDTWLHAAVRATLAQSVDGCPDVSDVAAFAEGNLEGPERERFERHAAGCQRCLDLLGTLARIGEQDDTGLAGMHGHARRDCPSEPGGAGVGQGDRHAAALQ